MIKIKIKKSLARQLAQKLIDLELAKHENLVLPIQQIDLKGFMVVSTGIGRQSESRKDTKRLWQEERKQLKELPQRAEADLLEDVIQRIQHELNNIKGFIDDQPEVINSIQMIETMLLTERAKQLGKT